MVGVYNSIFCYCFSPQCRNYSSHTEAQLRSFRHQFSNAINVISCSKPRGDAHPNHIERDAYAPE